MSYVSNALFVLVTSPACKLYSAVLNRIISLPRHEQFVQYMLGTLGSGLNIMYCKFSV